MAWLIRDGQVLASLEVAEGLEARLKGLWGRSLEGGGLLLRGARLAHSLGARASLDVAWLDSEMTVIGLGRIRPHAMTLPRPRAASVLLAEAGAFGRWGLAVGDVLELKE